jgi:hypothetical protein
VRKRMDRAEARRRVQDLANRLKKDGMLSREDTEALRLLAEADNDQREGPAAANRPTVSIDARSLKKTGPSENEIRICLDFGTAMSKAWATGRSVNETIPLVLGTLAGLPNKLAVPSSIFISRSGRIYLGANAETQHRQELEAGRSRFDNLKRMLSEAEPGQDLDDVPLVSAIDPTNSGLSKGDLLVLYLGWLTDLAVTALGPSLIERVWAHL